MAGVAAMVPAGIVVSSLIGEEGEIVAEYGIDNWPPYDWRLFSDSSVWNTPLDKTKVDPKSDVYIHTLCSFGPPDVQTTKKMQQWAFPLYFGRESDPLFKIVLDSPSGSYAKAINGQMVHTPPKMKPSSGSDGAFRLLDQPGGYQYHLRVAWVDYNAKIVHAHTGFRLALGGSGFGDIHEPPTGLLPIRPEDLAAGRVNHTVGVHIKAPSGTPVAPYDQSSGRGQPVPGIDPAKCLSFGNIIFLDLSEDDIDELLVPIWTKAILKGLATYGALVSFNGGISWTLTYEHAFDRTVYGKPDPWKAAGITFPLDFRNALNSVGGWEKHLRVLQPFARPTG
jgi:hypothetical protein